MTTFLLCDDDHYKLESLRADLRLEAWHGVDPLHHGTELPAKAIQLFARALHDRRSLPDLVLIDDQVEFTAGASRRLNGVRTMAAFSRLLDAFPRGGGMRPAFVLFTHLDPDPHRQLTFMEFGGTGIADRQERRDVPKRIAEALTAAPDRDVAWQPPVIPQLGQVHGSRPFWDMLFPLLPLLADPETQPPRIKAHLRLGQEAPTSKRKQIATKQLNDRKRALAAQVHLGLAAQLSRDPQDVPVPGTDEEIVKAAGALGLRWITEEGRREAKDLLWEDLLPADLLRVPIPPVRLRSDLEPLARRAWYRHDDDPRRKHGASYYPSPW